MKDSERKKQFNKLPEIRNIYYTPVYQLRKLKLSDIESGVEYWEICANRSPHPAAVLSASSWRREKERREQ